MLGCCGTPRGVNPNDKTVMINPPGAYQNGGVNENLTPAPATGFCYEERVLHRRLRLIAPYIHHPSHPRLFVGGRGGVVSV